MDDTDVMSDAETREVTFRLEAEATAGRRTLTHRTSHVLFRHRNGVLRRAGR